MTIAIHRSSKRISPFRLQRPDSVDEAVALWRQSGREAPFMAGGLTLIDAMKSGRRLAALIHIGRLRELHGISCDQDALHLGAGTTLWDLGASTEVARLIPGLSEAVGQIGNVRVRTKATIGGNVMTDDANFDVLPLLMALSARLTFANGDVDRTTIPADSLSWPNGDPRAEAGLLLEIIIPEPGRIRLGYDRTLRPAVTLVVGVECEAGRAIAVRASLACCYPRHRFDRVVLPSAMTFSELAAAAGTVASLWAGGLPEPSSDGAASGRYRRRVAAVLMRRQLERLKEDA